MKHLRCVGVRWRSQTPPSLSSHPRWNTAWRGRRDRDLPGTQRQSRPERNRAVSLMRCMSAALDHRECPDACYVPSIPRLRPNRPTNSISASLGRQIFERAVVARHGTACALARGLVGRALLAARFDRGTPQWNGVGQEGWSPHGESTVDQGNQTQSTRARAVEFPILAASSVMSMRVGRLSALNSCPTASRTTAACQAKSSRTGAAPVRTVVSSCCCWRASSPPSRAARSLPLHLKRI